MKYPAIIQIGDCLVSSEIFTEMYSCDYAKCKGCCCIIGDSGAPLEDSEADRISGLYPVFEKYMTENGRLAVSENGFAVTDSDGDLVTPLVGKEECAYAMFEDGNCLCAIERAYFNGEIQFRKPISCWLYPIRVSRLSNGMAALNLHRWHICRDAFRKGKKDGIPVFRFLKEPLVHAFGEEFYKELEEVSSIFND